MTVQQWKQQTSTLLKEAQVGSTFDLDSRLLLAHVTGLDQLQQLVHYDRMLTDEELFQLETVRSARLKSKPMAYILGTKEFYGRPFLVDEHTLIPRPDTETLVETVLAFAKNKPKDQILPIIDVCTGTGAIGITLALELGLEVVLSDVSAEALRVAVDNCIALLGHPLPMLQGDLLSPTDQKYGIIVSNPPYLTASWCDETNKEVQWEPRLALDGMGSEGLQIIGTLVAQSTTHLKKGGALFLECDYRQASSVAALLASHQFSQIAIVRDLSGLERVVWGVLACTNS